MRMAGSQLLVGWHTQGVLHEVFLRWRWPVQRREKVPAIVECVVLIFERTGWWGMLWSHST